MIPCRKRTCLWYRWYVDIIATIPVVVGRARHLMELRPGVCAVMFREDMSHVLTRGTIALVIDLVQLRLGLGFGTIVLQVINLVLHSVSPRFERPHWSGHGSC